MAEIILHQFQGVSVGLNKGDGYLNATKLCAAYSLRSGRTKRPNDWAKTKAAREYIAYVASVTNIAVTDLIVIRQGGVNEQGTWVHPDLADDFASWLSVEYKYEVSQWLQEWRNGGAATIEQKASIEDIGSACSVASNIFGPAYAESMFMQNMRRHHPQVALPEVPASDRSSLKSADALLTPTQLAGELGLKYKSGNPNPRAVNALLESMGLQEKVAGQWQPTEAGKQYSERKPVDTGGRSDRTQLLWYSSVLDLLQCDVAA